MGDDANRLLRCIARRECMVDRIGQTARFVLDGAPPVKAEWDDLVCVGKMIDQVVIGHADRSVGLHVARRHLIPL